MRTPAEIQRDIGEKTHEREVYAEMMREGGRACLANAIDARNEQLSELYAELEAVDWEVVAAVKGGGK